MSNHGLVEYYYQGSCPESKVCSQRCHTKKRRRRASRRCNIVGNWYPVRTKDLNGFVVVERRSEHFRQRETSIIENLQQQTSASTNQSRQQTDPEDRTNASWYDEEATEDYRRFLSDWQRSLSITTADLMDDSPSIMECDSNPTLLGLEVSPSIFISKSDSGSAIAQTNNKPKGVRIP